MDAGAVRAAGPSGTADRLEQPGHPDGPIGWEHPGHGICWAGVYIESGI